MRNNVLLPSDDTLIYTLVYSVGMNQTINDHFIFEVTKAGHKFVFTVTKNPTAFYESDRLRVGYTVDDSKDISYVRYDATKQAMMAFTAFRKGEQPILIAGKKVNGIKIDNADIVNKLNAMLAEVKAEKQRMDMESKDFVPSKVLFARGGDSWHIYVSQNEKDTTEKPKLLENIEKFLNRGIDNFEHFRNIASKLPDRHTGLYTDMWYEISTDTILESEQYKVFKDEIEQHKQKQLAEENRINQAFVLAKQTGKNQFLHQWSEECNDDEEECDIDNVYQYATPAGTTITERNHTW